MQRGSVGSRFKRGYAEHPARAAYCRRIDRKRTGSPQLYLCSQRYSGTAEYGIIVVPEKVRRRD